MDHTRAVRRLDLLSGTDRPECTEEAGGHLVLLIDLASPGVTVRPIKLIDGSYEVNEVFFDDVRVPAANLVGEENAGWSYAKFLLGNERTGVTGVGRTKVRLARAKERAAQDSARVGVAARRPAVRCAVAELENELLALELTQLRVVAASANGKPDPASSLLKLRGSELQQAATELLVDIAGPDSLPFDAGEEIDSPVWAQRARRLPISTTARCPSTAGRAKCSAASSRRRSSDCEAATWISI